MRRSRLSKGDSSKPKVRLKHWLEGRKIVSVRKMTVEEAKAEGWEGRLENNVAPVLVLDDGTIIYPSSDDEGNDVGMLFAKKGKKDMYVIPW